MIPTNCCQDKAQIANNSEFPMLIEEKKGHGGRFIVIKAHECINIPIFGLTDSKDISCYLFYLIKLGEETRRLVEVNMVFQDMVGYIIGGEK